MLESPWAPIGQSLSGCNGPVLLQTVNEIKLKIIPRHPKSVRWPILVAAGERAKNAKKRFPMPTLPRGDFREPCRGGHRSAFPSCDQRPIRKGSGKWCPPRARPTADLQKGSESIARPIRKGSAQRCLALPRPITYLKIVRKALLSPAATRASRNVGLSETVCRNSFGFSH